MADDYGYFGKGDSGYAHYMQTFNSTRKSSPRRKGGCLTAVIMALAVAAAVVVWLL